ncbi:hypothetical protein CLV92_11691 [Kineococcus xinjiangensis]|uniref:Ig-like domain-containing protein n=1 Tax=Kineococcus xinjiangensis TaxID=512762 RepID=A0A2S6IDF0_9ACTN|nr:hypothetical protein [Kineococcus xinjiangensis]PPK92229.1 hypothetical protein CLV92_11691 [Kineococcus xinjiangensis]
MPTSKLAAALLVLAVLGAGCTASSEESTDAVAAAAQPLATEAALPAMPSTVDGPLITYARPARPVVRTLVAQGATVTLEGSCLLDGTGPTAALLVWKAGTSWDPSTQEVVFSTGRRISLGASITVNAEPIVDLNEWLSDEAEQAARACGGADYPSDPSSGYDFAHRPDAGRRVLLGE